MSKIKDALTYDDVLLEPQFSEILPDSVDVKTKFSRNINLNIPLVSAAMDTVTESKTAICMAQQGGIGVIHKNMSIEMQAKEVDIVKKYEAGMVLEPVTISDTAKIKDVIEKTKERNVTGMPVIDSSGKLVGIVTSRDVLFETNINKKIVDIMTKKDDLIVGIGKVSLSKAKELLHKHRIEKLPIIDKKWNLKGLITIKDILKNRDYPSSNKDSLGRLQVAAAIGVSSKEYDRALALTEKGVNALIIDTAHGHSKKVMEMIKWVKKNCKNVDVIAGNIATAKACSDLIKLGVDALKVGIGPGSICTTRVIAGIGVPQLSAIMDCAKICKKEKIPFIADGGIKYSGDIVKALASGASTVMLGSMLAGTDEAPGEMILYHGRTYKVYRGMGSLGAMVLGSKDRYSQGNINDKGKLVPEGIEGQVPYRGALSENIYQMLGGLRSGMGYVGANSLEDLFKKAKFLRITSASLKESHPHDIIITKEAPNYSKS